MLIESGQNSFWSDVMKSNEQNMKVICGRNINLYREKLLSVQGRKKPHIKSGF